jgi:hypothetical protein
MPCVPDLRFAPPPWRFTTEMRWVLVRAFAPAGTEAAPPDDPMRAVRDAQSLGLAERIAFRNADEGLVAELGRVAAALLAIARGRARARSAALLDAAGDVADCAATAGIPVAVLKGAALHLGGYVPPGARPAGDVDLLVLPDGARSLFDRLRARGWTIQPVDTADHQLPPLVDGAGRVVELHVHLPGVRVPLGGPRFARFDALERAGLLESRPIGTGRLFLPCRDLLVAHVTVHAVAQHGFVPASYPLTRALADLCDLGLGGADNAAAWTLVARDLGARETAAVESLCRLLAAGSLGFLADGESAARALLAHAVAGVLDDAYRYSLVVRALAHPLSERARVPGLLLGMLDCVRRALRSPRQRLALAPGIARALVRRR